MKVEKIIESKHWVNKKTGATASITGAVPYYSKEDEKDWEIVTRGYTFLMSNGTIGIGRKPFKTMQEAIDFKNKHFNQ